MQECFVSVEKYHIIGIPEVIFHPDLLFDLMVEICEIQVGEILAQIIPDGHTVRAVDDLIEQGQCIRAFYLAADDLFEYIMVDAGIEFPNVYFQAISAVFSVLNRLIYLFHTAGYPTAFDARKRVCGENRKPNRFQHIHDRVVQNPIRVIG